MIKLEERAAKQETGGKKGRGLKKGDA